MIYLGGYSSRGGQGIGVAALRDGRLTLQATEACPDDPTFLAAAPDRRTVYAAHELADGLVSAFAVGGGGRLRALGTQPSGGAHPIHLSVHPSGRWLLCANWGTVTACAYDPERGRLEPGETVRTVPADTPVDNYPSAVLVSPDGRLVYVANRSTTASRCWRPGPGCG